MRNYRQELVRGHRGRAVHEVQELEARHEQLRDTECRLREIIRQQFSYAYDLALVFDTYADQHYKDVADFICDLDEDGDDITEIMHRCERCETPEDLSRKLRVAASRLWRLERMLRSVRNDIQECAYRSVQAESRIRILEEIDRQAFTKQLMLA